tara:strand:- start:1670 stop:3157 length:1488 start_codon:yes stop_codon:yes gene_type:complete
MAGFFKKLRDDVFGKSTSSETVQPSRRTDDEGEPTASVPPTTKASPGRSSYFVQIGLDFGTAFTKCICRDLTIGDKTWVYLPPDSNNPDFPFLISSSVIFEKGILTHHRGNSGEYVENGLPHMKMALEKVGLKEWKDPVLDPFRRGVPGTSDSDLARFVEGCATYLLAGIIGGVRADIRSRFPKEIGEGFVAVNMAVPAANADHPNVDVFQKVLRSAWTLSDKLENFPPTSWRELDQLLALESDEAETESTCFVYPEVSANVQGFVRSRTSREGLYLFSDTGAGTVDQSVFLFSRPDGSDHLTYLHAQVLPLGSGHLERLAADRDRDSAWENLERWRLRKENQEDHPHLEFARSEIGSSLGDGTEQTIAISKKKLIRRQQLNSLRVIFGGGGHCEKPYGKSVLMRFGGNMFHQKEIKNRKRNGEPFDLGMPVPKDLDLTVDQRHWIDRLTVAYGLSFEKSQLSSFTLPNDVDVPKAEEIWRPVRKVKSAPTKDEC